MNPQAELQQQLLDELNMPRHIQNDLVLKMMVDDLEDDEDDIIRYKCEVKRFITNQKLTMQQHITNLILEMIGEDSNAKTSDSEFNEGYKEGYNQALFQVRHSTPDLVTKIMNLMEYKK